MCVGTDRDVQRAQRDREFVGGRDRAGRGGRRQGTKAATGSATFRSPSPELEHDLLVGSTVNSTVANVGGTQVSTCTGPSSGGTAQTATYPKRAGTVSEGLGTCKQLTALVVT
jgi:hypothetical protein